MHDYVDRWDACEKAGVSLGVAGMVDSGVSSIYVWGWEFSMVTLDVIHC